MPSFVGSAREGEIEWEGGSGVKPLNSTST